MTNGGANQASKKIGFVGVGLMGHGMAKNLMEKGHALTLLVHRNRAPIEDLLAAGADEGDNAKAVAASSAVVIICVTGSAQLESVVYGDNGLLAGAHDGLIVIDCSTGEPEVVERVAADFAAKGARMADAPLARTPIEAEAGKLNTMVGAEDDLFYEIEPVLACFCENIFHMGPIGSGTRMKLVNNLITMGQATLIAEALCTCKATGLDLRRFAEVISAGGGNSGIFQMIVPAILDEGSFEGMKFSLENAAKDLRYYNRMTADAPVVAPMGGIVHAALLQAIKAGFADGLIPAMVQAQAKQNNLEIGKS